jgi:hypothetical protein
MTNLQKDKLDACNRVDAFNTNNANAIKNIVEYAAEQTIFTNALLSINIALQSQQTAARMKAVLVLSLKVQMANTLVKYLERAVVKATQLGNLDLANNLNKPVTYITKATKNVAVAKANDLRDLLQNNLKDITNVTKDDINEITNAIAAYNAQKDQPQINQQQRKATGTNPLPSCFKTAFKAIDSMYKLVNSYFKNTEDNDLVDELALAKQIIRTGIHHTGIQGTVTQNGQPQTHATISIIGTTKAATTNLNGQYNLIKVLAKTYIIQAQNQNGDTASIKQKLKRGQVITLDFDLK